MTGVQTCALPISLWLTTKHLQFDGAQQYYKPAEFPYIQEGWYAVEGFPPGSLAIYAGVVRVEETKGSTLIRVPRHSFIINGIRCLSTNLYNFKPAV